MCEQTITSVNVKEIERVQVAVISVAMGTMSIHASEQQPHVSMHMHQCDVKGALLFATLTFIYTTKKKIVDL